MTDEIDFVLNKGYGFQFTVKTEDFPKAMKMFKNYAMDIDYDETTVTFFVLRRFGE